MHRLLGDLIDMPPEGADDLRPNERFLFKLGHPKLIKLFPSARASFPPGFAQARIASLLMKTAIPEKKHR